jgi:hypothetical protein
VPQVALELVRIVQAVDALYFPQNQ